MIPNPHLHHRRSIRLPGYDYAQPGAYFITICTHKRDPLFGEIVDGTMRPNAFGETVEEEWARTADIRQEIQLDTFVVMPNHIHGIVMINDVGATGRSPLRAKPCGPANRSLGAFAAGFKSAAIKRINAVRRTPGHPVWLRNYYERVIRTERELNEVRE